ARGSSQSSSVTPAEMAQRYGRNARARLASGWYPHDPGAGRWIWRGAGLSGARKFLPVPARRRVVDYWRLIWPGYRDWSRRVLVRRRGRRVGGGAPGGAWRVTGAPLLR